MRKITILTFAVALIISSYQLARADVSIFGVTLGRPLNLPECSDKQDHECYKLIAGGKSCFVAKANFPADVSLGFEEKEGQGKIKSNVVLVKATFSPENFPSMFELINKKYGDPDTMTTTEVRTKKGEVQQKTDMYWSVERCSIHLTDSFHAGRAMLSIHYLGRILVGMEH